MPHDTEAYIHRIGRTGRAGEKGMAITFVNARQYDYLRLIEKGIQSRLAHEKLNRTGGKKREKEKEEKNPAKTPATDKKKPLSKYASRKGQQHSGKNLRSRRSSKPASAGRGRNKKRS